MARSPDNREHERFEVDGSFAKVRCEPFEVEGAVARVKPAGVIGAITGYPRKRHAVLNVSKGGLAFESEEPYKRSQKVMVLLYLPDRDEPLEFRSKVRWQKGLLGQQLLTVGVQFDPFGQRRGQNAVDALDTLRELEAEFGRHSDT